MQRGLLGGVTKRDDAFTSRGFATWKKAGERFTRHEHSFCHTEAVKRLAEASSQASKSTTSTMILTASQKEQQENRVALRHIFHAIILLSAQGLALRRRDEETGNLRQLLRTMAFESPQLARWLERQQQGRQTFLSPEIQRQVQRLLAHKVIRQLTAEVAKAGVYSVIVDETTDASRQEQVSICVRYVTDSLSAEEVFLGLYSTDATTGDALASLVSDALQRLQLPISGLRGQCYDGASNMSGQFQGM